MMFGQKISRDLQKGTHKTIDLLVREREREKGQKAVYYTSPQSVSLFVGFTTLGNFLWLIHYVGCSNVSTTYLNSKEGVILCIIIMYVHLFIGHCLIPLDPCLLVLICQGSNIKQKNIFGLKITKPFNILLVKRKNSPELEQLLLILTINHLRKHKCSLLTVHGSRYTSPYFLNKYLFVYLFIFYTAAF